MNLSIIGTKRLGRYRSQPIQNPNPISTLASGGPPTTQNVCVHNGAAPADFNVSYKPTVYPLLHALSIIGLLKDTASMTQENLTRLIYGEIHHPPSPQSAAVEVRVTP